MRFSFQNLFNEDSPRQTLQVEEKKGSSKDEEETLFVLPKARRQPSFLSAITEQLSSEDDYMTGRKASASFNSSAIDDEQHDDSNSDLQEDVRRPLDQYKVNFASYDGCQNQV